jgi:CRISPR system Cascade subunit CasA
MFLVQLAALGLHRTDSAGIFRDEEAWLTALRGLTRDYPNDEPWCLAVSDWSKPALLQPPVPDGVKLATEIATPDALDLLITARNHDLKQSIAMKAEPQDWLFALVSLQTGEGYGGAGRKSIARMNGGSSSRSMLGLAPRATSAARAMDFRPGAHFHKDVRVLLSTREDQLTRYNYLGFPAEGGLPLAWLSPWPEDAQLNLTDLDIWFIEICQRVRLEDAGEGLRGWRGSSKSRRVNAKHLNGALGDPWAPVHKTENKSFTLSGRDFDYPTLIELLLSGNWDLPRLARPGSGELDSDQFVLIAEALARGNSKTEGFKSRILPIGGKAARALTVNPQREKLHALAQQQINEIKVFIDAIRHALALYAARGDWQARKKEHYIYASDARAKFERSAASLSTILEIEGLLTPELSTDISAGSERGP